MKQTKTRYTKNKKKNSFFSQIGNNNRTRFAAVVLIAVIGTAAVAFSHAEVTILGGLGPTKKFSHPGIQHSKAQLDFVKAKVAAGQQPWKGEYDKAVASRFAKTNYVPTPVAVVKCSSGPIVAKKNPDGTPMWPQAGCTEQVSDANAAYTQALLWYYSGNEIYAKNAIKILNAWAYTITEIKFDQPRQADGSQVYSNGHFQAGWAGINFARAAEIMRYTYKTPTTGGWSAADIAQQAASLQQVYYPLAKDGWSGGQNRQTTLTELALDISVFTDDRPAMINAYSLWKANNPVLIHLDSDGPTPVIPTYKGTQVFKTPTQLAGLWSNPTAYTNGLAEETCRDLGHMMMGLGSMFNFAETSRMQGLDVYPEAQTRYTTALEVNAGYVNAYLDKVGNVAGTAVPAGWKPPGMPCPTFTPDGGGYSIAMGWEVAYNHYAGRNKLNLPQTKRAVERMRTMTTPTPTATRVGNHLAWEILTTAGTP